MRDRRDLIGASREALQQVGKDPAHLQPANFTAVDEFHIQEAVERSNRGPSR